MARHILVAALIYSLLCRVESQLDPVSEECLQCICEASTSCDFGVGCGTETCGPYGITWGYWNDGLRPVLNQDSPEADGAYARCANDQQCAARVVQNYMSRYGHDCNGDAETTCYDFAAIHRSGSNNCGAQLDSGYFNRLINCMALYGMY
ncbi:invertebrate-type lysozyme 3-like [Zootermopsis nevadensis]|uniref:lysozyme n=1 Tax=Zootermopsis nevadensis TaxID=136037 RepID=A0A067R8N7_ZOONE|nr:invertebrate-type lysozyme 3-like [Zootermopsis nevadensis]KDR15949.1 Lysozyme 3 [Zootermopsis nevadensis]